MKTVPTIDFDTMRVNCIQIHQETSELFKVADRIGVDLNLIVKSADELRKHELTKSWDGMGRYAKDLVDNTTLWDQLPVHLSITMCDGSRKMWIKEEAKAELLNCFQELGGNNLF